MVPLAGLDDLSVRLPEKIFAEPERLFDRARRLVRTRIRRDANDCAQHHGRQAETRVIRDDAVEPCAADGVLRHIAAKA
jgi:hypothetical protein